MQFCARALVWGGCVNVAKGGVGLAIPLNNTYLYCILLLSARTTKFPPLVRAEESSFSRTSHCCEPATMAVSALLKSRVRRPSMLDKLARTEDLIDLFPHGAYIGWSGFTGVGYPKYVSTDRCPVCRLTESPGKYPQLWRTMSRQTIYRESSSTPYL